MFLTREQKKVMTDLKNSRNRLTVQQYRTVKGQILAGDSTGAERGLKKLIEHNSKFGRGEPFAKQT